MEKTAKIFIVDDDLFTLNFFRQNLENLGYQNTSLFTDGLMCVNHLHQKPSLIFLDHNMGELTGFDVLKKIKRYDPNIHVVIVSAQENMSIAIDALKYGAFDYIIKGENELEEMKGVIERINTLEEELKKIKPNILRRLFSIF